MQVQAIRLFIVNAEAECEARTETLNRYQGAQNSPDAKHALTNMGLYMVWVGGTVGM